MSKLLFTHGVNNEIASNGLFAQFVYDALRRYQRRDWGDMDSEDKRANDATLRDGGRIFAAYKFRRGKNESKIWIITESDRSATTVLFPEEY